MTFFDGRKRPPHIPKGGYTADDLKRICYNCGRTFGRHVGYDCKSNGIIDLGSDLYGI